VASQKLIKGILGTLDEKLGTGLLKAEGKTLAGSGAKLIGRSPVKGVLAKPVAPESVHPDFSKPGPPLEELYHGTNRRVNYDRPGGSLYDEGLHLTSSPNIADYYSMNYDTPDINLLLAQDRGKLPKGMTLAGPRTYPMYADPGRQLDFPADPLKWNDPVHVADTLEYFSSFDNPDLLDIYNRLKEGKPTLDAFKDFGYDSVKYPHWNPYSEDPYDHAVMLMDPSRAVPKFSEVAQEAGKLRGVLSNKDYVSPNAENVPTQLGPVGTEKLTDDAFMQEIYHPSVERMQKKLENYQRILKGGMFMDFPPEYYKAKIEQAKNTIKLMRKK